MQRKEAIYSAGNLLVLLGLATLTAFTFIPALQLMGFLRTGVNLFSCLLISSGVALPFLLREVEFSQRMRSIGLRSFVSSFILSILLLVQMMMRGFVSTVPILSSLALALSGVMAYLISKTERIVLPRFKEILFFTSVIIVFMAPVVQLSLIRLGISVDAARTISIGLLIVFITMIYISLKPTKSVR